MRLTSSTELIPSMPLKCVSDPAYVAGHLRVHPVLAPLVSKEEHVMLDQCNLAYLSTREVAMTDDSHQGVRLPPLHSEGTPAVTLEEKHLKLCPNICILTVQAPSSLFPPAHTTSFILSLQGTMGSCGKLSNVSRLIHEFSYLNL